MHGHVFIWYLPQCQQGTRLMCGLSLRIKCFFFLLISLSCLLSCLQLRDSLVNLHKSIIFRDYHSNSEQKNNQYDWSRICRWTDFMCNTLSLWTQRGFSNSLRREELNQLKWPLAVWTILLPTATFLLLQSCIHNFLHETTDRLIVACFLLLRLFF